MDSRFSHLAGGAWASGSPLGQLGFSQLQAAGTAVKIQAMRIGLPTTHQPPSPQRGEVYFRGSPSLGQVRSLVDYSLHIAPPRGKGRRGKSPSICKEHLKTENLNDLPNFLRCSPNTRHRRPGLWTEPQKVLHEPTHLLGDLEKGKSKGNVGTSTFFRNCEPPRAEVTEIKTLPYVPFIRSVCRAAHRGLTSRMPGPHVILDRHRPGGQATRFSRLSLAIRHRQEVGRRNELPQGTEKAPE